MKKIALFVSFLLSFFVLRAQEEISDRQVYLMMKEYDHSFEVISVALKEKSVIEEIDQANFLKSRGVEDYILTLLLTERLLLSDDLGVKIIEFTRMNYPADSLISAIAKDADLDEERLLNTYAKRDSKNIEESILKRSTSQDELVTEGLDKKKPAYEAGDYQVYTGISLSRLQTTFYGDFFSKALKATSETPSQTFAFSGDIVVRINEWGIATGFQVIKYVKGFTIFEEVTDDQGLPTGNKVKTHHSVILNSFSFPLLLVYESPKIKDITSVILKGGGMIEFYSLNQPYLHSNFGLSLRMDAGFKISFSDQFEVIPGGYVSRGVRNLLNSHDYTLYPAAAGVQIQILQRF